MKSTDELGFFRWCKYW